MASGSYSKAYKGYTVKTTWSSTTNVAGNYSTITCKHYLVCNSGWDLYVGTRTVSCTAGETKSFTASSISTTGGTTITLGTTTHKVEHNSDGKKSVSASTTFNIKATISGTYVSSITATGTMTLDTIPRASTLTVDNGTLNTAQTLKITRADDSFTHTITYTCGSASGTIVTKTSDTSVSWTPPLSLASQNTIATNVSITLTLTTYSGSTSIGTATKTISCAIPDSVKPTCSISVSDSTGYADTYGGYIQGISKFNVVVTGTTSYGSPIASYSTTANGSTYTSSSFTTGVIKNSGTLTISSKVTDKRGRSGSASTTATVLSYDQPKITSLSVNRCDSDGTENMQGEYVKITYSCSATSLNSKNTLASTIRYKKTTDSTYMSIADIEASTTMSYTNRSVVIAADSGASYDVELSVIDNFNTNTRVTSVSTAFAFQHYKGPGIIYNSKNLFNKSAEPDYKRSTSVSELENGIRIGSSVSSLKSYMEVEYVIGNTSDYDGKTIRLQCNFTVSSPDITPAYMICYGGANGSITYHDSSETTESGTIVYLDVNATGYSEDNQKYIIVRFVPFWSSSTATSEDYVDFTNIVVTVDDEDMFYSKQQEASMGLGKLAEFEGGLDIGFPTRFNKNILDQFGQLINNGLSEYESAGIDANTTLSTLCLTNNNTPSNGYYYVTTMFYSTKSETARRAQIAVPYWYDANNIRRAIYMRQYLDGTWSDWYSASEGVVLYNNSSGTNGQVTLSESAEKFSYLEIFFTDNNGKNGGYTKVYSSNGKTICLSIIEAASSTTTYIRRTNYAIRTTYIFPINSSSISSSATAGYTLLSGTTLSHTTGTNYIKIIRVVGYV